MALSRRRLLAALAAVPLIGSVAALLTRGNFYYSGPISDHFDGREFFNPGNPQLHTQASVLRWYWTRRPELWPAFADAGRRDKPPATVGADEIRIAYIGHASVLIQTAGLNILCDPVWASRVSPFDFAGPRRRNPPGIDFADLPKIDLVLVSHNHYDHLDARFLAELWVRDRPRILTPLGNDTIIRNATTARLDAARNAHLPARAEAHDWGARIAVAEDVAVHFEPTHHWSARGVLDRRHALWASFVIEGPAGKVLFVGDSGYGGGDNFRAIREKHGVLRLALLPIGSYEPRWFMRYQHMNPEESVRAFKDLGAERAIATHHGTFQLTDEAIDAPRRALAEALRQGGIAPERFSVLDPGENAVIARGAPPDYFSKT